MVVCVAVFFRDIFLHPIWNTLHQVPWIEMKLTKYMHQLWQQKIKRKSLWLSFQFFPSLSLSFDFENIFTRVLVLLIVTVLDIVSSTPIDIGRSVHMNVFGSPMKMNGIKMTVNSSHVSWIIDILKRILFNTATRK